MSDSMIERVSLAINCCLDNPSPRLEKGMTDSEVRAVITDQLARAAIEAIDPDNDAFVHAVGERIHDARFSVSCETYPVVRSFIRALKDAALNEQAAE